jgi:hypothetical protein
MDLVNQLLGTLAAGAVIVGVVIGLIELRTLRIARVEQTVLSVYGRMGEPEFILNLMRVENEWTFVDFTDFRERATEADWVALWAVGVYFEAIGLMVRRGTAPLDLVDDLVSGDVTLAWPRMQPIIAGYRQVYGTPQTLEWFEYLHHEIQRRESGSASRRPG